MSAQPISLDENQKRLEFWQNHRELHKLNEGERQKLGTAMGAWLEKNPGSLEDGYAAVRDTWKAGSKEKPQTTEETAPAEPTADDSRPASPEQAPINPKSPLSPEEKSCRDAFQKANTDFDPKSSLHKKLLAEAMADFPRPWKDLEQRNQAWAAAKEKLKGIARDNKKSSKTINIVTGGARAAAQQSSAFSSTPDLEVREESAEEDTESDGLALPESTIMSSRVLGELYQKVFAPNEWPVELAFPALATSASVLVPPAPDTGGFSRSPLTHLYTALIGEIDAGKSQVIEWSAKALGIYAEPRGLHYVQMKFGSAEQMWKYLSDNKKQFSEAVLINPDEWSHVMAKAGIPDASFASTLTSAFYSRHHSVTIGGKGGGKFLEIPFAFSIIGGVVKKDFGSVFGATTIGGLYDRNLLGLAPEELLWSYRPFPYEHPLFHEGEMGEAPHLDLNPVAVRIDPSVFEVSKRWAKDDKALGRIPEVCIRVATIFASIDGRELLKGSDLEKLWPLVRQQKAIRGLYQPNPGLNYDAVYANVALDWINTHASGWKTFRELQKGTNFHRRQLGPKVCFYALKGLAQDHEIELWVSKKERENGKQVENPLPADYRGNRPREGSGLVRKVGKS